MDDDVWSELAFIEKVNLNEIRIVGNEKRLVIVDTESVPFILVGESVSIEPGTFNKLINKLLLDTDSSVCPRSINVPLEAVLFRVILGHNVRIVDCLNSWHELHIISCLACRNESPESVDSWGVFVSFESDSPSVMEPQ